MQNPAIVLVAFNRPNSLTRLLLSLGEARYPSSEVTLIISIDYQDSESHREVVNIARGFDWQFGEKIIIEHTSNMGLRNHILSCGDFSQKYPGVIILEDDLVVSNEFFNYATQALDFYESDQNIAGISLYSYEYEELGWYRFYPLNEGADTHFIQWASSWGQLWTTKQWKNFREWYDNLNGDDDLNKIIIPNFVKRWEESWKKFYIGYLVVSNKFFVYPFFSFTTVKDEMGVHHKNDSRTNSVSVVQSSSNERIQYRFIEFGLSKSKYDSFFQPLPIKVTIDKEQEELVEFDLYNTKQEDDLQHDYIFTVKSSRNVIRSFSNKLVPYELNLIKAQDGGYFNLVKKNDIKGKSFYERGLMLYGHRKVFAIKEMLNVVVSRTIFKVLNKLK